MRKLFSFLLITISFCCNPPEEIATNICTAEIHTVDSNYFCFITNEGLQYYMAVFRGSDQLNIPCEYQYMNWQGSVKLFTGGIIAQNYNVTFPNSIKTGDANVSLSRYGEEISTYRSISGSIDAVEENGKVSLYLSDIVLREANTNEEIIISGIHVGCE